MPHGELVSRFEEFAFVEYALSKDATAARGKLHHSVVHGQKLEVHFDTKIPPQFHSMIDDSADPGSPAARRSNSDDRRNTDSDYSTLTSPASGEFRSGPPPERQPHTQRYAGGPARGPGANYDNHRYPDRGDNMRAPMHNRYNDAPGNSGRNRYPDERAGPPGSARGRYMPRTPGGFRPQGRGGYGSRPPRSGYNDYNDNRSRPQFQRGPYDRNSRGPDDYNSGGYQGRGAPDSRPLSPDHHTDYNYRNGGFREPQSANGRSGWNNNDDAQNNGTHLHTPRHSRSRSASPDRNHGTWHRSPSPVGENLVNDAVDNKASENSTGDGGAVFTDDMLFDGP
ncbi:hypothetical protein GGF45_001005 [Coemansia sp. RSA 551]|nr:hypothetical protein GGF45_001005 [Coemansia sp. RSA 551]